MGSCALVSNLALALRFPTPGLCTGAQHTPAPLSWAVLLLDSDGTRNLEVPCQEARHVRLELQGLAASAGPSQTSPFPSMTLNSSSELACLMCPLG